MKLTMNDMIDEFEYSAETNSIMTKINEEEIKTIYNMKVSKIEISKDGTLIDTTFIGENGEVIKWEDMSTHEQREALNMISSSYLLFRKFIKD